MTLIRSDDVQAGMTLGDDVYDQNGRLLLRGGTVVTDRELRLFSMWGIGELDIVGADTEDTDTGGPSLDPDMAEEYELQARELFRHADLDHPAMSGLFRECVMRLARQGGIGGRHGD